MSVSKVLDKAIKLMDANSRLDKMLAEARKDSDAASLNVRELTKELREKELLLKNEKNGFRRDIKQHEIAEIKSYLDKMEKFI